MRRVLAMQFPQSTCTQLSHAYLVTQGSSMQLYTTVHCTAFHFTALYCTAIHCTALHCTALQCTTLNCTALQCTTLHCTALQGTACHSTLHASIITVCTELSPKCAACLSPRHWIQTIYCNVHCMQTIYCNVH